MFLKSIDLQGFKTFAKKTTLSFLPPQKDHYPLTAIVGPNGSGKSNLADAVRWALGEQSLKLLRGKDSTDVIFSGSSGKGKSGFAEVSLTFDNTDGKMGLDTSEVVVTRRLFRDGESTYLVNGQPSRLIDIQLMLSEAGVGQKSYSVVGQGMVDSILTSSPEERKHFFDDATGVRPLQIKRHQAMLKLRRTYENLAETEVVLQELEPRLRLLRRQTRRLEEREEVELTLRERQTIYFQSLWFELADHIDSVRKTYDTIQLDVEKHETEMKGLEEEVAKMEETERRSGSEDTVLTDLHRQLREAEGVRRKTREEEFRLQKEIELTRVRAQSTWAPLPLLEITRELDEMVTEQKATLQILKEATTTESLNTLLPRIETLFRRSESLAKRLKRPAPEDVKIDPKLEADLLAVRTKLASLEEEAKQLDLRMDSHTKEASQKRTELFTIERTLRERQRALHDIENQRNERKIELARLEERRENLHRDIDQALKEEAETLRIKRPDRLTKLSQEEQSTHRQEIERLRYKLELIGGIDPEIVTEFQETEERFNFLNGQATDLREAMKDIERVVDELDERIHKQSEEAFKDINREFQKYFQVLFGGGSCSLVKLSGTELETDADHNEASAHEGDVAEALETIDPNALSELKKRVTERSDRVVGIEIQATPPGKKLKALNLLSGGERALTSIALLAAIMATNPAPFVILDEVDAALDESNTVRFATILDELRKTTQYIVVTHNRATMEKSDVLYGVTMNDDGVSQLLSVKMEDMMDGSTARR